MCLKAYKEKHPGFKTIYEKTRDAKFVGAVIINMPEPKSDDESMPGLQDRAIDDWSSVSSGDDDDDDSIHADGEMTGWKHKSLQEIISGQHHGILKRRRLLKTIITDWAWAHRCYLTMLSIMVASQRRPGLLRIFNRPRCKPFHRRA